MLQILRKKAQSTVIQIIVVIIALVFIFWGVGTNLRNSRQAALVVNGEEITFQQYQQAYDRAYQRMSDQFGGNMPKGLAESLNIKQQVINQLIQATLLRQGAREMGLVVSGEEVRKVIEQMVQFQENGKFSMDRYKTVLAANRLAPTKFEASLRVDQLSELAIRAIGDFSAVATDFETQQLYSRVNEKISVDYVAFSPASYRDSVKIDDKDLAAWFAKEKESYKSDPKIKLKYLSFTFAEIAAKIEVDEDKIKAYYQENINDFREPEKRKARHILLKATPEDSEQTHKQKAAEAADILAKARQGEDFAALAKQYSEGPSKDQGGDLGYFSSGQMVPAFNDAVFNLKTGDISDVVKTQFGYHIIKLEDIKPATTKSLDQVRQQIVTILQQKEAETLAFQLANDAYEAIISAGSLAKYSEINPSSTIHTTDFFDKSDAPAQLRDDPQFMSAAFALSKGELSSLVKGESGYAIFYVEDMVPAKVPELADIRDKVVADYTAAKAKEAAKNAAADLLAQLRDGKKLGDLAAAAKLTVLNSGLMSKSQQNENSTFPPSLLDSAFALSASAPAPQQVGEVGDKYYVYVFKSREIPELPKDDAETKKYRDNLLQYKKQMLLSAWISNMESDAKISRHESL
jgi:peptidyl-prolyl cis-trans isomerase D